MRVARMTIIAACGALAFGRMGPVDAWQQPAAPMCRVSGRATSGNQPLPGVSVLVRTGDVVKSATSTDPDGTYHLSLPAGAFNLSAELTGFTGVNRPLTTGAPPCDQTVDFQLVLAPRGAPANPPGASAPTASTAAAASGRATPAPGGGRGQADGTAASRFETLTVQAQAAAAARAQVENQQSGRRVGRRS
jgi:hypothetical protein